LTSSFENTFYSALGFHCAQKLRGGGGGAWGGGKKNVVEERELRDL